MKDHSLIYTNENCIGCNKCIKTCPVLGANIACDDHGSSRIEVDGAWSKGDSREERFAHYNEQFASLNLEDYVRTYTDRSNECPYHIPSEEQLEEIFLSMRKDTESSRKINCSCCGYDSCYMMAEAIFNGFNKKEKGKDVLQEYITSRPIFQEVPVLDIRQMVDGKKNEEVHRDEGDTGH